MACISGYTNDVYYSYFDCCGNIQTGIGPLYQPICADQSLSGSAVGVYLEPLSACTEDCNTGPLSYNFVTNGNCGTVSAGTITINVYGGSPGYTIDNITPGSLSAKTFSSQVTYTGLTGGTYVFRVNDSLGLQNNEIYFNVIVSDCFEATIDDVIGTNCGSQNGQFIVNANSPSSPYKIIINKNGLFNNLYETSVLPFTVSNLGYGVYDAFIYDYGFATARTESVVISASTSLDYGFWVVNAANCVTNTGKAAVTGTTGIGPFSYLWSDGQTTQLATGLTQGVYSVQVTDYYGCVTQKEVLIGQAQPLGVGLTTTTNPNCSAGDGSFTINLTGGTAPFYYSLNNGLNGYTLSNSFTVNNLNSGTYTVSIRDANFCPIETLVYLAPQGGVYNVSNTVTNSQCNQNSGSIYTTFNAPYAASYSLGLTGQSTNTIRNVSTPNQNYTFSNLPNDTYTLQILGQNNTCSYTNTVIVSSQEKFSVNVATTGATCGSPVGIAKVTVGTGFTNWDTNGTLDYVLSNGQQVFDIPLTSVTYNNLAAGQYTITVTDDSNCSVTKNFTIGQGGYLNSVLLSNNCVFGNDGVAGVAIFNGEPTFTYNWSPNVPLSQTGATVSGLSGGSYYVTVTDSSGCTNYHTFNIDCTSSLVTGTTTYDLCSSEFTTTSGTKRGVSEMFFEGFLDLTSGYTGCILDNAILTCEININNSAFTQTFANITSIDQIPNDNYWIESIDFILSTIDVVGSYKIDVVNNKLTIKSDCQTGSNDPIGNANFSLEFSIEYYISCENVITPTPTATPTATPTPSPTPTPTATPSPTPTPTATPSPTPTPSPTAVPAFRFTVDTRIVYPTYTDSITGVYYSESSTGTYQIQLPFNDPLFSGLGTINWGDGNTSNLIHANRYHTYTTPGVYQISIFTNNGNIPNWEFDSVLRGTDRLKFLSIDEWGGYTPNSNDNFTGCYNLSLENVIDEPNLNGVNSLNLFYYSFSGSTKINNIGNWDVTDINNLFTFFQPSGDISQPGDNPGRLTTESYNQLLIGWANYGSSLQNNVDLTVANSTYSGGTATAAKTYLETTKGWVIDDGGPV